MLKKYFGYFLISLGVLMIVELIYIKIIAPRSSRPFANYTLLTSSWENYKTRFINADGRVIDYSQNSITTSEGQSYALLQAVYLDDKPTFDKVWTWTKNTLKRPEDNLFGWRWGELPDSKYGFYPDGGINAASDADSDIALALIFAARRWRDDIYMEEAKKILNDLWKLETAESQGKRYLIAGNWAAFSDRIVVNPSYFSPYAWRIFAEVDKEHPWQELIAPAYELINNSIDHPLDKDKSGVLPPNWLAISTTDGSLSAVNSPNLTSDYSYDAMRLPWRIALDFKWNQEPSAKNFLSKLKFLETTYTSLGYLPTVISHSGEIIGHHETPAMYSTALGYFIVQNPTLAKNIYEQKIISLYSNDNNSFKNDLPYYEENWLWFGAALYLNYLKPII